MACAAALHTGKTLIDKLTADGLCVLGLYHQEGRVRTGSTRGGAAVRVSNGVSLREGRRGDGKPEEYIRLIARAGRTKRQGVACRPLWVHSQSRLPEPRPSLVLVPVNNGILLVNPPHWSARPLAPVSYV